MKAKYCSRSKQEFLYQQAHFKRSISDSYDSMYRGDITRRGDIFEQFTRNADTVMDISPKRNSLMETVWEMERSCPSRRQECATKTEYQRRILAKIESLESTDSPFKQTLDDYIDILATGWGSIYRTDHSTYLEVQCGMNNAQCTCSECWHVSLEENRKFR